MTPLQLQSLKILALAFMGAPLFILLALYFVLTGASAGDGAGSTPLGVLIVAALAAVAHGVVGQVYKAVRPIPMATHSDELASSVMAQVQANFMLRFSICELPLIASIALAFILTGPTLAIAVAGVVLSELLFFRHVLPNRWNMGRVQERLDAQGARSGVVESFERS